MIEYQKKYNLKLGNEDIFLEQIMSKLDDELKSHQSFYFHFYGALKNLIEFDEREKVADLTVTISEERKKVEVSRIISSVGELVLRYKSYQFSVDDLGNMKEVISSNDVSELGVYRNAYKNKKPDDKTDPRIELLISTFDCPYFSWIKHNMFLYNKDGVGLYSSHYNDLYPKDDADPDQIIEETMDRFPKEWPTKDYPGEIAASERISEYFPTRSFVFRDPKKCGIMNESIKKRILCGGQDIVYEEHNKYQISTSRPHELLPESQQGPFATCTDGNYVLNESVIEKFSNSSLEKVEEYKNIEFINKINQRNLYGISPSVLNYLNQSFDQNTPKHPIGLRPL